MTAHRSRSYSGSRTPILSAVVVGAGSFAEGHAMEMCGGYYNLDVAPGVGGAGLLGRLQTQRQEYQHLVQERIEIPAEM